MAVSPKSKNPVTIAKWIWRSYLKTALIPVMMIELVFLGIFFGINIIMKHQLSTLMNTAVNNQISKMVSLEAESLDNQLSSVKINAGILADAAVFYNDLTPIGAAEWDETAGALTLQSLMKDIYETNPLISSVFLNTHDSLNVIYPPLNVNEQFIPDWHGTAFDNYNETGASLDSEGTGYFTDVRLDTAGRGWMTSALAPVHNGTTLEGVAGIDVSLGTIAEQLMKIDIPADGYVLLTGNDGTILALTENGKEDWPSAVLNDNILDVPNLYKTPDLAEFAEDLSAKPSGLMTVMLNNENNRVSWETVKETGWKLLLVVPLKSIFATIDRVGSSIEKIGIILMAGMIAFAVVLFRVLYLRSRKMSRSLSQPLLELDHMAERIGAGDYYQKIPDINVFELRETSSNIVNMGHRLGDINRYLGDVNRHLLSTQEELKEKESYLQAVIHSIDDAIVELDEDGIITNIFINEAVNRPAHLDFRFSSIDSIFENVKAEYIKHKLKAVIESGRPETIETEVFSGDEKRWVMARLSLISSHPVRVVVTARDITERVEMEESIRKSRDAAEAANRAKSQFLSNMSHELRTPLNAVLGFAQVLELDPSAPLTGMQKECVYEIVKAGNHLLALINEVLDLARIEAGKTSLSMEPVSISTVVEETMTLVIPTAEKYSVKVYADKGNCGGRYVKADKTKLKQVLINLLSNAIKYNKPGGKVDYFCEADEHTVRFTVSDTGIGIPEEEMDAIFMPFYRLNNMKNVIEGTGVGLALVRQLTEMMDGVISVKSTTGQGSRFCIELPASEEPALLGEQVDIVEKTAGAAFTVTSGKKILYIEDNQANLRLVERVLAPLPGIAFLFALTAEEGIETARREKPDVILMDINLPGMDGYEAFLTLQDSEETKSIPVIAVSANAMEGEISHAIELGFSDYITKPIKIDVFIERISRVISRENT